MEDAPKFDRTRIIIDSAEKIYQMLLRECDKYHMSLGELIQMLAIISHSTLSSIAQNLEADEEEPLPHDKAKADAMDAYMDTLKVLDEVTDDKSQA